MTTDREPLDPGGGDATDHNCFGCGRLNEHGLQLNLIPDPDGYGVFTAFVPASRTEGYTGMVHGGIITTVLDEVMAWSLARHGIWAVTGQLTTRYRKPVGLGEATTAIGFLVRDRGRAIEMRGEIRRDADRVLLANATATFIRVPPSKASEWQSRYGSFGAAEPTEPMEGGDR
jgi:acyl-coenzyme A thioesterase PaaI-like protein